MATTDLVGGNGTEQEREMPYIDHPATQNGPVSVVRWAKFHLGEWMRDKGITWSDDALYPDKIVCPECGQKIRVGWQCDHIPF